jgi:periplasmic divalent cation tolerance protein
MNRNFIVVMTALDCREDAEKIGRLLIEKKLAACVSISAPVTSIYRWQGNVVTAEEWILFAKASDRRYRDIEKTIRQNHPYELPEIIAIPLARGEKRYLQWLVDATMSKAEE